MDTFGNETSTEGDADDDDLFFEDDATDVFEDDRESFHSKSDQFDKIIQNILVKISSFSGEVSQLDLELASKVLSLVNCIRNSPSVVLPQPEKFPSNQMNVTVHPFVKKTMKKHIEIKIYFNFISVLMLRNYLN